MNMLNKIANIAPPEADITKSLLRDASENQIRDASKNQSLAYGYAGILIGTPVDTVALLGKAIWRFTPFSEKRNGDNFLIRGIQHITWSITTLSQAIRTIAFAILFGTPYLLFSTAERLFCNNVSLLSSSIKGHNWQSNLSSRNQETTVAFDNLNESFNELENSFTGMKEAFEKMTNKNESNEKRANDLQEDKLALEASNTNLEKRLAATSPFTNPEKNPTEIGKVLVGICEGLFPETLKKSGDKAKCEAFEAIFAPKVTSGIFDEHTDVLKDFKVPENFEESDFKFVRNHLIGQITEKNTFATEMKNDLNKAQTRIAELEVDLKNAVAKEATLTAAKANIGKAAKVQADAKQDGIDFSIHLQDVLYQLQLIIVKPEADRTDNEKAFADAVKKILNAENPTPTDLYKSIKDINLTGFELQNKIAAGLENNYHEKTHLLNDVTEILKDLRDPVQKLITEADALHTRIKDLQASQTNDTAEVDELLAEKQTEIEKLQAELQNQRNDSRDAIDYLKAELNEELQKQRNDSKIEIDELNAHLKETEGDIAELREQIETDTAEYNKLIDIHNDNLEVIDDLKAKRKDDTIKRSRLRTDLTTALRDTEEVQERFAAELKVPAPRSTPLQNKHRVLMASSPMPPESPAHLLSPEPEPVFGSKVLGSVVNKSIHLVRAYTPTRLQPLPEQSTSTEVNIFKFRDKIMTNDFGQIDREFGNNEKSKINKLLKLLKDQKPKFDEKAYRKEKCATLETLYKNLKKILEDTNSIHDLDIKVAYNGTNSSRKDILTNEPEKLYQAFRAVETDLRNQINQIKKEYDQAH